MLENKKKERILREVRIRMLKSKIRPITGHEGPEGEETYKSTLSLTSALDGVGS